jgi:UTP-glucose-1-phosphate uridylyltransferase
MNQRVTKAIFPVAVLGGTRFLPATKASPMKMLSIVDKPLSITPISLTALAEQG